MNVIRNHQLIRSCTQLMTRARCLGMQGQNTEVRNVFLEPLVHRELVRVSGSEVVSFLQGLTTNDMRMLESPAIPSMFTMFLNKAGRVMYDAIIYRTPDPQTVLIECDKDVSNDLRRHLKLYRVRRKIQIDEVADEFKLWVMFGGNRMVSENLKLDSKYNIQIIPDPRLSDLGLRLLTPSDITHADLSKLYKNIKEIVVESANNDCTYLDHRYELGVAEGVVDLQPGKQFPLEANCDLLNGVSFNKGCYIGQELTARVHHTGVIRKRHMPIQLIDPLTEESTKIIRKEDGTKVGNVLGSTAKRAIGLLRVEQVLKCKELFIDGKVCHAGMPQWWPSELLSNVSMREGV